MMNIITLGLLLSSLVSAGFFSPPPPKQTASEGYVLKETDRVTILEYERETIPVDQRGHNPPPPPPPQASPEPSLLEQKLDAERSVANSVIEGTKNMAKQAGSVLPNLGSGSGSGSSEDGHSYSTKELICDAYGKCKHKLAGVFGKAKEGKDAAGESVVGMGKDGLEAAVEKTKQGIEKGKEVGEMAAEKTKEGLGKAKDSVYETVEMAAEKTKEGLGKAKDSVYETGEMAVDKTKEGLSKAKEAVPEKLQEAGKKAKDSVYETGEMVADKTKEGLSKAKEVVPEQMQEAGKIAGENAKRVGEDLKKVHDSVWDERSLETKVSGLVRESRMNFSRIFHRGIDALNTMGKHAVSKEVVQPTIGVAHVVTLSTAYGSTIWVTFVSSHVLAGALPRQQFGMVQSRIYPVYFRFLAGCVGGALGTRALRHPYLGLALFPTYVLLVALGLVLVNLLLLEPKATKVMFEKMRLEKEEGGARTNEEEETLVGPRRTSSPGRASSTATETAPRATGAAEESEAVNSRLAELDSKLKNLNALSSCLNVVTLVFLTWQLVYVGKMATAV